LPKTILVVEDTVDTRELLCLYFSSAGFTVWSAADGSEGLCRAKADHPDLIVTDIQMPILDGIGMIKQLRAEPEYANIPIITLSAYGDGINSEAMSAGATRTFRKPMNLGELTSVIVRMLDHSS
jgi:two-component system chemotaxis response regulator CheY